MRLAIVVVQCNCIMIMCNRQFSPPTKPNKYILMYCIYCLKPIASCPSDCIACLYFAARCNITHSKTGCDYHFAPRKNESQSERKVTERWAFSRWDVLHPGLFSLLLLLPLLCMSKSWRCCCNLTNYSGSLAGEVPYLLFPLP